MRKILRIVEDHKAPKILRFINYVIDTLVIYFFFFTLGLVSVILYDYLGISFLYDGVQKLSGVNRFLDTLLTGSVSFIYTFLMEYFTKGRTLGKYITGTKAVSTDLQTMTLHQYFIRNISRIVPFDGISFLGNNGWHDNWSETRVVKIKNLQNAIDRNAEIEKLGEKEG